MIFRTIPPYKDGWQSGFYMSNRDTRHCAFYELGAQSSQGARSAELRISAWSPGFGHDAKLNALKRSFARLDFTVGYQGVDPIFVGLKHLTSASSRAALSSGDIDNWVFAFDLEMEMARTTLAEALRTLERPARGAQIPHMKWAFRGGDQIRICAISMNYSAEAAPSAQVIPFPR